jgi:hypothetical protein
MRVGTQPAKLGETIHRSILSGGLFQGWALSLVGKKLEDQYIIFYLPILFKLFLIFFILFFIYF